MKPIKFSNFIIAVTFLLILTSNSYYSQVYVDNFLGDDLTNKGSSASPFKTISKALTVINSGGTIKIYCRTYDEANVVITKPVNFEAVLSNPADAPNVILTNGITINTTGINDTVHIGLTTGKFNLGTGENALVLVKGILDINPQNVVLGNNAVINRQSNDAVILKTPACEALINIAYSKFSGTIITGKELPDSVNNFTISLPSDSSRVILLSGLKIKGILLFDGGNLTQTGKNLFIEGNITESSNGGFFSPDTSSNLYFSGNADQVVTLNENKVIPSNLNIYINKTNASNTITLGGDKSSLDFEANDRVLFFGKGLIITGTNVIKLGKQKTSDGLGFVGEDVIATKASHIVGNCEKFINGTGSFNFPVGSLTAYRSMTLTMALSYHQVKSFNLIVNFIDESPEGTDLPGDISNYVPFYWLIRSDSIVDPSTRFDLEMTASRLGYPISNVENLIIMRRGDGSPAIYPEWVIQEDRMDYANYNIILENDTCAVIRVTATKGGISPAGTRFTIGIPYGDPLPGSGTVKYDNAAGSVMAGVTVTLTPASGPAKTTTTDAQGVYTFTNVANGTYTVTASSSAAWLPSSAVDALLVANHFSGKSTLSGLKLAAADVNNSSTINNTDALLILKRAANASVVFARGNWVFSTAFITLTGTAVTADLKALATGDVNGDAMGTLSKASIQVNQDGNIQLSKTGLINLPVKAVNNMNIGAMTLRFNYPSELVSFESLSSNEENIQVYDNKEGKINIAWADLSGKGGIDLKAKDELFSLQFKLKEEAKPYTPIKIELNNEASEIANKDAEVYNASLSIANIDASKPTEFALNNNYPNPFNPVTTISYEMPVRAKVSLAVFNTLGEQVASLVNSQQEAGYYEVKFDGSNLASGVYFYRLTAGTDDQGFIQTRKFMLMK